MCDLVMESKRVGNPLDSRKLRNLSRKQVYHSMVLMLLPSVWYESLKPSIRVFSSKMLESILTSFKNQVDTDPDNQVDIFAEAKENRPQSRPIPAILALIFSYYGLLVARAGLEPATP